MRIANIRFALVLPIALLLAAAASMTGLRPYTATYDFARNGDALGSVTFTLRQTPDGWSYDSQTKATSGLAKMAAFDVSEHSEMRVNGGVLETRSYRYRQTSVFKSRERSIDVDAAAGRIVAIDKKGEQDYPYQPGVLDRQSVTLGIAQDLTAGKRGTLSYNVADNKHIGTERYQVGKQETLRTPNGSMRTVAVTRVRDSAGGRVTASWFGLDNGFVPVRIVQTEPNGEVYEMQLVSLRE